MVIICGILSRILVNGYLSYNFYRENYKSIGEYLKSTLTIEHYLLWWDYIFSTKENIFIVSLVLLPILMLFVCYLCLSYPDFILWFKNNRQINYESDPSVRNKRSLKHSKNVKKRKKRKSKKKKYKI